MQAQQFQLLAAYLLKTHYGLMLTDTTLCEDYPQGIDDGDHVFAIINRLAEKFDLVRVDNITNQCLTAMDETEALENLCIAITR
ncbi:TA system toxin CbtA family protein [Leeia oryzae]|uniref:TA system toxin CbtA family protein n=1 Tax=Leeia oryzae TaxID=356662 RepID=UPI000381487F|nr:TA system toxin CbtA family protein [Leeia oryzae]